MVRITAFAILAFAASTFALTPDPAGAANQGNGAAKQFIGGACNNNADCASACCAAQSDGTQPVCSGPGAQFQVGKLGCGSAEGGQSSAPPQAPPQAPPAGVVNPVAPANPPSGGAAAGGITPDPAGAKNQGNGAGKQFIGAACDGNADCASACCAAQSNGAQSVCSGPGAQFQAGKLGCGSAGKRAVPVQW